MKINKMLGVGNTATVYEWEKNKALKLFYMDYPREAIEKEFQNAMLIRDFAFSKPKVFEVISYEGRIGIVYDRVEGDTLMNWVMKMNDLQECAIRIANLHKSILTNKSDQVPNYKDVLKSLATNLEDRDEILKRIDNLQDGDTLCHGDFHPGNILVSNGELVVLDFMNICHGPSLYDVARTVFLVEYTPVSPEVEDKELLMQQKRALADMYLLEMKVPRDSIRDYLAVIMAVRKAECPTE